MSQLSNHQQLFRNDIEICRLIEQFEGCSLRPENFTHQDHLTVALWYVVKLPLPQAIEQFRAKLTAFANHYQLTVYHETITLFWLKLVAGFVRNQHNEKPLPELCAELIKEYDDSKIIYHYYSKKLLASPAAKTAWQPPDLQQLKD